MNYECPKKGCKGELVYQHSTKRGDKYECNMCGKKAWYEGSAFDVDIPGL